MRRREFISILGGAAAWPFVVRAQERKLRRIGVLTGIAGNDAETKARLAAFSQELQRLGWVEGRDVQLDIRGGAMKRAGRKNAAELAAGSDVILVIGNAAIPPLVEATRTVPIVFTVVIDPVGAGFVQSLSKPGGNVTGFMMFEYSLSESGRSYSNRSRRASRGSQSFGNPHCPPALVSLPSSRLRLRRRAWR